ncbi:hypothetical protein MTsPCn5_00770 [Croceitalea sp. MTPC5]|nr:hypothetical protein MTsPCn5_00770 [Croceitalea sp. MTPC5]
MNITLILAPIFLSLLLSFNLNGQTPKEVKETFEKMYPNENDPDWHIDKNGNYESNFKIDGIKYRADYNPDGTWIETETSISEKELPFTIRERLEQDYKDCKIVEIERVRHFKKGLFYDVELKRDGKKFDVEFKVFVKKIKAF